MYIYIFIWGWCTLSSMDIGCPCTKSPREHMRKCTGLKSTPREAPAFCEGTSQQQDKSCRTLSGEMHHFTPVE